MSTGQRVVVVGAGIAGVSAVQAMRRGGFEGDIVLLGDEPTAPYRRPPLSKEVLRGEKTAEEIRIKPESWYADQRVDLRTGTTVTEIDLTARTVGLDDGDTVAYDRLLLATGGVPRTLRGQNADTDRVLSLRRLADVGGLRALLDAGQALIVGGGLIGSELAASARALGCEVTVLEFAETPMAKVVPAVIGERYAALHAEQGVRFSTGVEIAEVSQDGDLASVRAADGRRWTSPLVVVATGVDPVTDVAEKAGLRVDDGIVVDRYGQTSVVGVYAAGDVANWPHPLGGRFRSEHWQGAQNQGTAIGKSLAGAPTKFAEVPWAWSDQYGHNLQVTGWPEAADEVAVEGSLADMDFIARFRREGALIGAVGVGKPLEIRAARGEIAETVL